MGVEQVPAPFVRQAGLCAELADLRAEVERLAKVVTAVCEPEPAAIRTSATGESAAEPRSRDGRGALAPATYIHGGLPYADRDSPEAAKIGLYRALFAGR